MTRAHRRKLRRDHAISESSNSTYDVAGPTGELDDSAGLTPIASSRTPEDSIGLRTGESLPEATPESSATVNTVAGRTWPDLGITLVGKFAWLPWSLAWFAPYALMIWQDRLKDWNDVAIATVVSGGMLLVGAIKSWFRPK